MRTLASFAAATILLTAATSSIAAADEVPANAPAKEAASAPRPGQVIRDANGRRLGAIQSIQGADVIVIMDLQMYHIPVATLSMSGKGWQTSLLRSQLR